MRKVPVRRHQLWPLLWRTLGAASVIGCLPFEAFAVDVGVGMNLGVPLNGSRAMMVGEMSVDVPTPLPGLSIEGTLSGYQLVTYETLLVSDPIGGFSDVSVAYQTSVRPLVISSAYTVALSPSLTGVVAIGGLIGTAKRTGGLTTNARGYGVGFTARAGVGVPLPSARLVASVGVHRLRAHVGGVDVGGSAVKESLGAVFTGIRVVVPLGGVDE